MLTPKVKEIIKFFKAIGINLEKSPCFNCPIEKRGYPCLNPNSCELLLKWIEKVGD
jgi:hypothetical protein